MTRGTTLGNSEKMSKKEKAKGYGSVIQILAIKTEAPLGKWRIKSGSFLRNAMLEKLMLFNSEAWHGRVKDDVQTLSRTKGLINAHSKVPKKALYLETGEIPLNYTWASRRLMFLQSILKRDDKGLTRLVYETQKKEPLKGDFVKLIEEDAQLINFVIDDEKI